MAVKKNMKRKRKHPAHSTLYWWVVTATNMKCAFAAYFTDRNVADRYHDGIILYGGPKHVFTTPRRITVDKLVEHLRLRGFDEVKWV